LLLFVHKKKYFLSIPLKTMRGALRYCRLEQHIHGLPDLNQAAIFALDTSAALLTGLFAGINLGTGIGHGAALHLPAEHWILRFQAEDALFRRLMPPVMWLTMIALASSAWTAAGRTQALFAGAAVLLLIDMGLTIALMVPRNRQFAAWSAASAPPGWQQAPAAWVRLHWVRIVLVLAASLLAIAACNKG
jgi:uncharacterized membrane protein